MGVFPAARYVPSLLAPVPPANLSHVRSRFALPEPFHPLMTDEDSPIIDFYPEEFDVDMNGKKMLWQGVALLPFIDPGRLLEAMATKYGDLSEAEIKRNTLGSDTLFVSQEHPLYDYLEGLYTKRKIKDVRFSSLSFPALVLTYLAYVQPVDLDTKRSKGIAGAVLPDPVCIPGSTFDSPLPSLPDIPTDKSISASFSFPPQRFPHRSMLLPGVKHDRPVLSSYDKDGVRRGGTGGYESNGFHVQRGREQSGPGFAKLDRGSRGGGGGGGGRQSYPPPQSGGGGGYGGQSSYGAPQQQQGGQQQGGRDPYGGYDSRRGGGGGQGGYGGASSYGGHQQQAQPSYGGYASAQGGYRPPPMTGGGYQPPPAPQQGGYGGYGQGAPALPRYGAPPPAAYGAPPPSAPAYQGYGGYGGNGQGAPPPAWQQGGRGGGQAGRGQERRY